MKRIQFVLIALVVFLCAAVASAALGPVTASSGAATGNANTVSVNIPGLVGVDLESNLTWDFSVYNAPLNSAGCTSNYNQWPISITCASAGSGTLYYDPTNSTDASPSIGTSPLNSTVTAPATLATLGGNKAIWLAFFCSRSSGTMAITTTMATVTGTGSGITAADFMFKGSTTNNTYAVGGTTFTPFVAATAVAVPNLTSLPATFGWTRADQFVTLQLPYNANLGSGTLSSSVLFTINK